MANKFKKGDWVTLKTKKSQKMKIKLLDDKIALCEWNDRVKRLEPFSLDDLEYTTPNHGVIRLINKK